MDDKLEKEVLDYLIRQILNLIDIDDAKLGIDTPISLIPLESIDWFNLMTLVEMDVLKGKKIQDKDYGVKTLGNVVDIVVKSFKEDSLLF